MSKHNVGQLILVGLSAISLTSCSNLPGSKGTQGAVIGGAGGAAAGAAIGGSHHRGVGALIGGALGAAGGYVVGAHSDKITGKDHESADQAARHSQEHPATAEEARRATTADLNNDGFVTLDEVVAMRDAGLSDSQMLDRMRATGQIFELTTDQQRYLRDRGVSQAVVDSMGSINKEARDRLMTQPGVNGPAPTYPAPNSPTPTYPTYPSPTYPSSSYPSSSYPGTVTTPQGYPPTTAPAGLPPVVGQPPASVPRQY